MNNDQRNVMVNSYFKNGELFIEFENEDLNLEDLSEEQLYYAVKEGLRSALYDLA
ncbi:hypothetical protein [Paenibacillus sp. FSL L8-0506]|uniref:hypothetical protein n=1 Tax=Paenibacillus sp. FSL L8-0506 TaxID=2975335 RepID=UPI0030FB5A93